jgi:hypothetical protein
VAVVSELGAALVISTYLPMSDEAVEVLAVVLELGDPPCRHPLTVILFLSSVVLLAVVVLGLCAIAPNVVAQTIAAAIPIVRFIYVTSATRSRASVVPDHKEPAKIPAVLFVADLFATYGPPDRRQP